jgi:SAM-dependent methyltransferase
MTEKKQSDYVGQELELFAEASGWKQYFASTIEPYIHGTVAEVGAGLGSTTRALCRPDEPHPWFCIEPDRAMAARLAYDSKSGTLPSRCKIHVGTLVDMAEAPILDTILYIDVLEHIADDAAELANAAARLNPGGRVIVLSPAWPHLYSAFDLNIGHFRRYTKQTLAALRIEGLQQETSFYLDSAGYLTSLANRLLLKQSMPTPAQIKFWDCVIVPVSRILDPLLFRSVGRSVISVWQRQ